MKTIMILWYESWKRRANFIYKSLNRSLFALSSIKVLVLLCVLEILWRSSQVGPVPTL